MRSSYFSRVIKNKSNYRGGDVKLKKVLTITILVIMIIQVFSPCALAIEMDSADIIFTGRTAPPDLLYRRTDGGIGSIICSIVGYYRNNKFYPVYCLNGNLPGAETAEYSVNISDYINNDKVWRIVTNGFPYNNMGLSDDDAYLVTKIAIFCVTGNADFNRYTYDESRPVTVQTYQALKNLIEVIAEDETIKRQTGTITINKEGALKEFENYYAQEYSMVSRLEEERFEIKNLSGFPNGTFVGNSQNGAQTVFNPQDKFRIIIPKSGFTKDINGSFEVVGKVKNYPIFYGEAPSGYQNYTVTFDSFGDELAKENLSIPCNTGSLKVTKIDADTREVIEGIEFELRNNETNKIENKKTDLNGEVKFENLYPGIYTLIETQTKEEYILNEDMASINIEYNKQTELIVENEKIKGAVKIVKQDKETQEKRLSNVSFELYDEDMNLLETLETDENGEAVSQKYPSVNRKYYLKETQTSEGYILDSELKEIILPDDSVLELYIQNEEIPKEPEIIIKESEPQVILIEKKAKVIIKEIEPEPIYEEVVIGEPRVVQKAVKLPKTGM